MTEPSTSVGPCGELGLTAVPLDELCEIGWGYGGHRRSLLLIGGVPRHGPARLSSDAGGSKRSAPARTDRVALHGQSLILAIRGFALALFLRLLLPRIHVEPFRWNQRRSVSPPFDHGCLIPILGRIGVLCHDDLEAAV